MDTTGTGGISASRSPSLSDTALLISLALCKLVLHLAVNLFGGYGIFRDELYYLACSDHLAWGYVDQPPFSIAVLWFNRLLFGDSLFALRMLPAVAGAVVVVLAGLITKALGGERFAQGLAACCVLTAPLVLWTNSVFSMNAFDLLFWTLSVYLIILIQKDGTTGHWIMLGVVLGLGLLNKISVLWLGASFAAGLILTPDRKLMKTPGPWIAGIVALLFFLPHLIWQVLHGYPTIEFIRNATGSKYLALSPLDLFAQQILNMNPLTFPIWLGGLLYTLVASSLRRFRLLPIMFLTVFLILVLNGNAKAEYLTPLFPMLFALGAVVTERFTTWIRWTWLKPIAIALPLATGIAIAPMAIPALPVEQVVEKPFSKRRTEPPRRHAAKSVIENDLESPTSNHLGVFATWRFSFFSAACETFIAYSRSLGVAPSTTEKKELGPLPQHYADMFGWEKMVAAVAAAYSTLTPEEQSKCALLMNNYGEAGAVDYFGSRYNLPKAISGHNNYWLWGPQNATGEVVIRLGGSMEALRESYSEVVQMGTYMDDYGMPYENNLPVWICKNRRSSLKDDWAEFRHYE